MSTTNIEDIFPMSPLQQGILFHAVEPGQGLYLSQIACRLRGLDPALFEHAWKQVVNRHAGLRSAFVWKATERPVQVVARRVGVPFRHEDWRGLTDGEMERKLEEFLRADRACGLQLSRAPLMRLALLRTGEDRHILVWTYHHLILDGWCRSLVLQEALEIYQASVCGIEPALAPSQPYRRYVDWLERQDLALARAFWRERLRDWQEPTPLPLPAPAGPAAGEQFGSHATLLPEPAVAALRALTSRARLTPATAAQGAFALLLARYSGKERVLFGTVVSGRPGALDGVESIVGLFANTQPVLAAPAPASGLVEWLSALQEDLFEQRVYEHCPLSEVQKCAEQVPAGRPLFDAMFAFQSYPQIGAIPAGAGFEVEQVDAYERADIPLTMMVEPGAVWRLHASYDRFQLADVGVLRLLEHFRNLLAGMAERPGARLFELSLLSEAEQAQILGEWNDTAAPDAGGMRPVHELFSAQAAVAGEAPAVVWDGGRWSFREVEERAGRLARRLCELGVGPEVVVALFMGRSPELLVSLLAVLKAGGAFLPLDPVYPVERLSYLLADSRARVVLTREDEAPGLPADLACPVVRIDDEPAGSGHAPEGGQARHVAPSSLAYVFYTSGSTGSPKGVAGDHRTLVEFALEMGRQLDLSPADRMLQFASPAFDVLLEEVFPVWLRGGAVAIAAMDDLVSPHRLSRAIEALGVTFLELPAAFWHPWVQELVAGESALPASLRGLIVGAEKPAAERLAQWRELGIPLIYVFGLTETGVTSSLHRFGANTADLDLPIGRPVGGARLYVLDPWGEPVPAGVPGELWIAGDGVARGYLGRPAETAWRFVPDRWSARPGERLYRTGDLVRCRWDGALDFLGRIDDQVKIRGIRIELGEIEAALRQHPAIGDAAVVVHTDESGDRRLVGFVSPAPDYSVAGGWEGGALLNRRQLELWPSHGEYPIYDESLYRQMMQDEERNRRYRQAIRQRVPGKVVLDVGTGGEAVLARLAVEAGAARVYAIERSLSAFAAARDLVERLGLADRIQVILGEATNCELPERVDVCVSELIGPIGGSEGAAAILNRVRRRCLKEGGEMVPRRCTTRIAAIELPEEIRQRPRFGQLAAHYARKVLEQIGENGHLRVCVRDLRESQFLSDTGTFEVLDFDAEVAESYEHELRLQVLRAGRLDGFLLWIELEPEVGDAVSSLVHECSWLPLLFPVFAQGEPVEAGDVIEARVGGAPCADGIHPDYWIAGSLHRRGGGRVEFSYLSSYHEAAGKEEWFVHRLLDGYRRGDLAADRERVTQQDLRRHLARTLPDFMLPASYVALPALPLTPNGKLDRRALPKPGFRSPAREQEGVAPRSEAEAVLLACWKDVLGIERIGVHDNFFDLGGDSILSLRISASAHRRGLEIAPMALFKHQTIAELAATLPPPAADRAPAAATVAPVAGPVPLTPVQRWFFAHQDREPEHWNMPILLHVAPELTDRVVGAALERLTAHEALRLRFVREEGGWSQRVEAGPVRLPFLRADLGALPAASRLPALEAACGQVQKSFDLAAPPLLKAVWFDLGEAGTRLFLVAHHLVMDSVSWQVLVTDLEAGCEQLVRGNLLTPLPPATPWSVWAARLAALARSDALETEAGVWLDMTATAAEGLPVDLPGGDNVAGEAESVTVALDGETTGALLRQAPRAYRAQIQDLLLTALVRTFHGWTGAATLAVELEGHGREDLFPDLDLSRTVGWFTSLYPVRLARSASGDLGDDLRTVKEALRRVPRRGIGYGLLRELGESEAAAALRARPQPEVLFNYLGQIDAKGERAGRLSLASEPTGDAISPASPRGYLLEVNCRVSGGSLEARFTFSSQVHRRETVAALARGYVGQLQDLVAHCARVERPIPSPADFPLARLDLPTLDGILGRIGAEVEDIYPLAHQQRGMLFHSLLDPTAGTYVAQFVFALRRSVAAADLRRAWREVVERTMVLRTAFLWESLDEPVQVVLRRVEPAWSEEDWTELTAGEADARLRAWLRQDRERGFELTRPPLARAARLQRRGGEDWLVLSLHQAVLDGWSLPLLFEDFFALCRGTQPSALPGRPPYREYVGWLAAQDLGRAELFWREQLAGFTHPTPLAFEPPDRGANSGQGVESAVLPATVRERLLGFARHHRLTVNTLVQGAWALLLARTSGEAEVVFGSVVSGRPPGLSGVEAMIGLFINTLPVRVRAAGPQELVAWLTGLQEQQAEAEPHAYAPLVDLHRWSDVPSGRPLFDSIVVFENYPMDRAFGTHSEELGLRRLAVEEQTNYALTLIVHPEPELRLTALYQGSRFGSLAIRRALSHLAGLLEHLPLMEAATLADLPLVSEAERHQILREWNDTGLAFEGGPFLHGLFTAQVSRTPDAVAVVDEDRQISYLELDRRSSLLARRLRANGSQPEIPVGICLDRSIEMVVGLFGILKAGSPYLPLDPEYPARRRAAMIHDAGLSLLVVAGEAAADLDLPQEVRRIALDQQEQEAAAGGLPDLPSVPLHPESAAYVIYTSGSTGQPKGAVNSHRAICNRLLWMQEQYRLDGSDRILQKTPFGFDVSVWEFFWTLACGSRLVMAKPGGHRDSAYLRGKIVREGITTLHFVPSMLQAFLAEPQLEECASLARVICSGEALPADLAARFFARSGAALYNLYGPTEAAVDVTAWTCEREAAPRSIPIGRPISNLNLYVLGPDLEPLPAGVAGELYIGGVGVGRGYLGQPALTADRFVPDPFRATLGERMYRTGDQARYHMDGSLDFLGRRDHQVKLRGFRIELGEIEAALRLHPAVRDAAAAVATDAAGHRMLVAYYVPAGEPVALQELRGFVGQALPAPMVPGVFVALTALPLSPNGKLDRKALPPVSPPLAAAAEGEAPRFAVEEKLAAIWADVLGRPRVGIRDNFFELGGDSILAMMVVSRAARSGVRLTPKSLFENPTIADLAAVAEPIAAAGEESGPVTGEVPLTPVQHWFFEHEMVDFGHFNLTTVLEPRHPLDAAALARAVSLLVMHHDALRLRFHREGGLWRQYNAREETNNIFSVIDLSVLPAQLCAEAAREAQEDLVASLDLAHGPLVRVGLLRAGGGEPDRLLLSAHHLATDAVSGRILVEDLTAAYRQARRGIAPALPPKTTSFKVWAERLRDYAQSSGELDRELAFWSLNGHPAPAALVPDFPAGENTSGSFRTVRIQLPPQEVETLAERAQAALGMQLGDLVLTALACAVSARMGGAGMLVDLEWHGREELFPGVDLSRTVGWFTAIYPVLLHVDVADPGSALQAVKEQVLRIPRHGIGYGLLRYLKGGDEIIEKLRPLSGAEILFNFLGRIDGEGETDPAAELVVVPEVEPTAGDPHAIRRHLLRVDGFVTGGRLEVVLAYSENLFRRSTIAALAESLLDGLRTIGRHLESPGATGYTPSEFDLVKLGRQQLDRLARKYQKRSASG